MYEWALLLRGVNTLMSAGASGVMRLLKIAT